MCQSMFDELKKTTMEEPIMKFPDYLRPFQVQTNASNFVISELLIQDDHPIAYESRKQNDTERGYPIHDKEMTAIIYWLHVWIHYLLGGRFVIQKTM